MACFFIIPMEKQAINFPENCAQCAIMLSSLNRVMDDDTKYRKELKFEALCIETCKLGLEAMEVAMHGRRTIATSVIHRLANSHSLTCETQDFGAILKISREF